MTMLADYFREREGLEVIETAHGFAAYEFLPHMRGYYIVQIYVKPEHRRKGAASGMADAVANIARDRGCKELWGSVAPDTKGATSSLKALLAYGFELVNVNHQKNLIMFKKEI